MIFSPDLAAKVLDGSKTQTRRRVKPEPCRYVQGRSYAVQDRRGGKALGRITIRRVTAVPVQSINEADAIAEGFADRNAFLNRWHNLYLGAANHEDCWRIEFTLDSDPTSATAGFARLPAPTSARRASHP